MAIITYRDAIRDALKEEMARDEQVYLLGEDIAQFGGSYKTCVGLFEQFGKERVRNTPLSEMAVVGCALGSAMLGRRPVAEIMYVDFTACCMSQIVNEVAKTRYMYAGQVEIPMVIRTQGGAGRASAAQHAQSLEAWFTHVPGLYVVMPSTPYDAKGLLKTAIRDNNPILFIEHKLLYNSKGEVPEQEYTIPLGKADIKRPGKDVTILTWSRCVDFSLKAAIELEKEGIDIEVVDLRSLKPLDEKTILASVEKTGHVVVVHEAVKNTGFGAELVALINEKAFDALDAPVQRVAGEEVPMPFNPRLQAMAIPDTNKVMAAVKKVLSF
ncbi:MAG: alpha-ketoacid dehydrogenase subunit beta [Spirochaetales bacterium]|nr:alpha-ketoacid dehydrogenase subunit beta [Spirochaetales bacterium]